MNFLKVRHRSRPSYRLSPWAQRQVGMFLGDLRQVRHHRRHGGVLREIPEVLAPAAAKTATEDKDEVSKNHGENHGKMGKSWENHGKTIGKWENHGKTLGK